MNMGRPKIIAIVTGFISIAICIAYLLLITIFDFRTYLNDQLSIISSALSTSLTKILISKSIQSITAGWLIRIVGLSLIEYFKNGQDWGDGGIQEVVDKIYRISKREDILNNFVREAISRIEMKKYFKSNKSLPPLTM